MKNKRQEALLELIRNHVCQTQEDLQEQLIARGFAVTQSTVSRDIKQLRIIKALDANGHYRYMAPNTPAQAEENHSGEEYRSMFARSTLSVEQAYHTIVIKCYAGMASGVCVAVDKLFADSILGSLAGDDTIFIVTRTPEMAEELCKSLNQLKK